MENIGSEQSPINSKEASPQLPKEFTPVLGKEITLQRTDGTIEGGWIVMGIDQNSKRLEVHKKNSNNEIDMKHPFIANVERFNRQAREEDIVTSQNFAQLEFTINGLEGLQGSNQFYNKDYLLSYIEASHQGIESVKSLTRTAGLRDTVKRLIQKELANPEETKYE